MTQAKPQRTVETFEGSIWSLRPHRFPSGGVTVLEEMGQLTRLVTWQRFYALMMVLQNLSVFQFKVLVDMTAVDYPSREPRFDVVYMRLSVRFQTRIRVKVMVDERTMLPSVTPRYDSANWAERECYDMYGVTIVGHPDMRRILTDYGFEGHPLRKDFPLTGYTEVRYDEAAKRVVSEPVELGQDFRAFEVRTAWQPLPDEVIVKGASSVKQ